MELYKVEIADDTLVAPRDGRIQYRVANVGEVLAGRRQCLRDARHLLRLHGHLLADLEAGKVKIRRPKPASCSTPIPTTPIPAKVSFIATQAQFTPKTVETQSERDKLMFRIRVRIDPERLRGRAEAVRSGLPGVAYVATDPAVAWPPQLQRMPPQ